MVTVANIKQWKPEVLNEVADLIRQRTQVLIHSGDDYNRLMPMASWSGPAADAAQGTHQQLMTLLESLTVAITGVGKGLAQASDAIPAVQRAITNAEELARKYGFTAEDDGTVIDHFPNQPLPPEMHPEDRARARDQVVADLQQAIRTAEDIDNDLNSLFFRATLAEGLDFHQGTVASAAAQGLQEIGLTLPDPPVNGTPAQNAAWWATFSDAGKSFYIQGNPEKVGNLDGIPAADRSKANIGRIPIERAKLLEQRTAAQQVVDNAKGIYDPSGGTMKAALHQLQLIDDKIKSLDTVEATMDKGGRQLLHLDTTHERVQAAVAVGDVDNARNVSVFTPGFTTTVNGDLQEYDQNMQDLKTMSDRLAFRHGGGSTATVTWIGYQAPQTDGVLDPSTSVAGPETARAGGESLAKFYNGIGATHDVNRQPLHLTALGHSYGSTTTGFALGHQTPVQDAVLFGSPGQGSDHLNVPQGHLYSEHNVGDTAVPFAHGTLGPSPYYTPDATVDYRPLSTDASTTELGNLAETRGHGGYFGKQDDDSFAPSTSMYNMAAITTGHPDMAKYK